MSRSDPAGDLPFVDEHRTLVAVPPAAVWRSLGAQFTHHRATGADLLAHLLGTVPRRAGGPPLTEGAAVPGFAVAEAVPGRRLRLAGRHRFSRYVLRFDLADHTGGTLVSARTYAEFPGPHGALYRLLVIGSGGHRLAVRRMLRDIRDRAERDSA
ncbi:hypothetical protein GCM10010169_17680 [Micromonospora fulviviridis]|uniref:hypothetical protein n=1 Tax=Micromonospora fulviviridis TaxID=47860 RepID=UPI001668B7E9|nr:hypothetical protein [Micromonospora fulviviridis]GGR74277.1 hypothetical protein GCM10010169_17680 [Micromonospora fulviviridis]